MAPLPESERWVFTKEELRNTPSQLAGLNAHKETQYRFDGCSFISSAGQKLNVPQHTIATAQVYFHRFFMYRSFTKYEKKAMASCCLFLAGKVEDTPKRLHDILSVSYSLERRGERNIRKEDMTIDPKSEEYWNRKNKLLTNERTLLQTLGFDLEVEHPYNKMLEKCRILGTSKPVAQLAWNLINDSLRGTTVCLEVGPDLVSTAVIRLAAQEREYEDKIRKPTDGREWWQAITIQPKNVNVEDMDNCMVIIKSMFSAQSKLGPNNPEKEKTKKAMLTLDDYKRRGAKQDGNSKANPNGSNGASAGSSGGTPAPDTPTPTPTPTPAVPATTSTTIPVSPSVAAPRGGGEETCRKRPISEVEE